MNSWMTTTISRASRFACALSFAAGLAAGAFAQREAGDSPELIPVFQAGDGAFHTYRIPALVATTKGTLLAFAEARKQSASDTGDIDLVLRSSLDGGKTWGAMQTVWDDGDATCGNPCPIVDRATGKVILLLTRNNGADKEAQIVRGEAPPRTVWLCESDDDGATWSAPHDISNTVRKPEWRWYATGPGHGIQLRNGRLVAPCDHSVGPAPTDMFSHVLFSDDHGATWQISVVPEGRNNECTVAELSDGSLYLNMRNYRGTNRRAVSISSDNGLTWGPVTEDATLVEPVCQASVLGIGGKNFVFANPASTKRENMTIRMSEDDCSAWGASRTLWSGPAAYSDLAVTSDATIGCLFECGNAGAYERIVFVAMPLTEIHG